MKTYAVTTIAILVASMAFSTFYVNVRLRSMVCTQSYRSCEQRCDDTLRHALEQNESQRSLAQLAYVARLVDCNANLASNRPRPQCASDAKKALDDRLAQLEASDVAARETREQCVAECRRQLDECEASNASKGSAPTPRNVWGTVTANCIEGGAPCYKPVSEFCQRSSGHCDQCWRSLCGGGDLTVETYGTPLPVNTTLVAATDPSKNARVLATSTMRGNQVVLNVPSGIKLGQGEQLYFGFSSQTKLSGPVDLRISSSR